MIVVAFAALSAAGALGRWQLIRLNRPGWPAATLGINVVASFVVGALAESSAAATTLVGVAFLGSFSTFSAIIRELNGLSRTTGRAWALGYLAVTLLAGVGAALVGLEVASGT